MTQEIVLQDIIPEDLNGKRLDQAAAKLFSSYSRTLLKQWIEDGSLVVNGTYKRPRDKVFTGDTLALHAKIDTNDTLQAQEIPLDIVFEDDSILVINKPINLVVHPAAGNPDGTLLNGLLFHSKALSAIPRAGIIHRLDKDTSGLLVVAKTLAAHTSLVAQLQARTVTREYACIVAGVMTAGGKVEAPIGRHPSNRLKMAVVPEGKPAITHYRVIERFRAHTWVKLYLETGRTHQIRVHMNHIHYPLVGDLTYGSRRILPPQPTEELKDRLTHFNRQALHARLLGFVHPETNQYMEWESDLPDDFAELLTALQQDSKENQQEYNQ